MPVYVKGNRGENDKIGSIVIHLQYVPRESTDGYRLQRARERRMVKRSRLHLDLNTTIAEAEVERWSVSGQVDTRAAIDGKPNLIKRYGSIKQRSEVSSNRC